MQMQSNLSVQESVLNHLNDVLFWKMRELRKNDCGIGLDHKLETSEKEFLKIDFKVDYSDIDFLDDWQLIRTIASAKKRYSEDHWKCYY
jgi:hypothetical protein